MFQEDLRMVSVLDVHLAQRGWLMALEVGSRYN